MSIDDIDISKNRRALRWSKVFLLLSVVSIMIVEGMFIVSSLQFEKLKRSAYFDENFYWLSLSAEAELGRLGLDLLSRAGSVDAGQGGDVAFADSTDFRLQILWSRLDLLTKGNFGEWSSGDPAAGSLVNEIVGLVRSLESSLITGGLSASAASELLNRAIVRSKELTRAALEADRATKDRVFDTINRLRTLTTLGLASGLGSVVMLGFFAVGYVRMMQRERTYIARINRVLTESVQEREYFIKVASHELRNSAQAALALLDRDWTTDGRIRSGTMDAMIGFRENVDSLLDFARSISGRVDLSHSEIDVAQAVHAWVASASYGTGKRVVVDVDCLDHAISVQRTVLFRCFQNILTNALRHARSEVRVAVEILGDGCALKVRVQDDGPGIPKDVFASLRGRQAVHNESGGTLGMGLLIVKALIASVGGRLQFPDSKAGAVVEIEIPIRRTPSQIRDDRPGRVPNSARLFGRAPASSKLIEDLGENPVLRGRTRNTRSILLPSRGAIPRCSVRVALSRISLDCPATRAMTLLFSTTTLGMGRHLMSSRGSSKAALAARSSC